MGYYKNTDGTTGVKRIAAVLLLEDMGNTVNSGYLYGVVDCSEHIFSGGGYIENFGPPGQNFRDFSPCACV